MKLKNVLLATAGVAALATTGFAGDTTDHTKAAPVLDSGAMFKSGIYGGAQIVVSRLGGKATMQRTGTSDVTVKPKGTGLTLGLFAGYRHVMNTLVAGAETGINLDTVSASKKNQTFGTTADNRVRLSSRFHMPLQAMVGMIFADNILGYAKAGLNFKNIKVRHDSASSTGRNKKSRLAIGFMPGVGAEYAFAPGMSARAEFNYEMYSGKTNSLGGGAPNIKTKNVNAMKFTVGGVYAI